MSINLPNGFSCVARTAVFEERDPVDFRHWASTGLPDELVDQLQVRRFLVTTSTVESTVSGDCSITFTETILKIPVNVMGQDYLFPVATFVDHEYSLIRGYLLGFNKIFVSRMPGDDLLTLTIPGYDLDFRGREVADLADVQLPKEHDHPFLLWTDYSVGVGAQSHGYATLVVEDYSRSSLRALVVARERQTVASRVLTPQRMYEIRDTFVITGSRLVVAVKNPMDYLRVHGSRGPRRGGLGFRSLDGTNNVGPSAI
jgi:hypothetical protein